LNAELELANARLGLVQSRHDAYVARAGLLSAMGLEEAQYLIPGARIYSPQGSLKRVESLGTPPWAGAVAHIDSVAAPSTPPPRLSVPGAGAERPADMPPLTQPTP
jgi:hypothetical protein